MSARPIWFGPEERPLFGWLHEPDDGQARGGVVCCPALGIEATSAYRGYKALAESLERAGYLVLRFEYDGTGNSSGSEEDEDRVEGWIASIHSAIAFVRSSGCEPVGLVGLRLGATLAAAAADADPDIEALVLWDPCVKGSGFLREQQALKNLHLGDAPADGEGDPESVEVLGSVYSRELADELGALDIATSSGKLVSSVLVLTRSDRPAPKRLIEHLGTVNVEWREAEGQAEFIGALPDASVIPGRTIDEMTTWIGERLAGGRAPIRTRPIEHGAVMAGGRGARIVERSVRLGRLGLFGIVSEPLQPTDRPTVVFLNAGLIHHVGPARLWVTLGRELAAIGIPTLRLDLSGLGESPVRPGQRPNIVHPVEALDDIREVVEAMTTANPAGVILAGLCAGAYHALEGGLIPNVRGICAINPVLQFDPPEVIEDGVYAPQRLLVQPFNRWVRPFLRYKRLAQFGERTVPSFVWWALEKLRLYSSPVGSLGALVANGVPIYLLCGEIEALQFTRRARWTMRRLARSGMVRLDVLDSVDHTLFGASARRRASEAFLDYVWATFGGPDTVAVEQPEEIWALSG